MEESDSESNSQSGPVSSKPSPKTPKRPTLKTPAKVHTSTAATTGFGPHGSSDPSGVSSSDKATPKRTHSKPILTPLRFFELTRQADLVATLQEASSIYNALGALLIPGKQPNASNLATALCKLSPPEELGSFLRKIIK